MLKKGKIGVLLVNLGTPDDPSRGAVYRYLKEFLLDKRVIDTSWLTRNLLVRGVIAPFRSGESGKLYQKLWTDEGSPLKVNGIKLTDGVREKLGDEYIVELAMRYQSPSIESAFNKLIAESVSKIIVFPLFPHYASASTGSVHEEVMRLASKQLVIPDLKLINSYHDDDAMCEIFAENARIHDVKSWDHILFSYHGLPVRQLVKGDNCNHCQKAENCCHTISYKNQYCYSAQCFDTTKVIAKKLGLKESDYTVCFQSRLGRAEWVKPYTSDVLKERADAGDKSLLVLCPAFVSDCLETTIEVMDEYLEEFEEMGGERLQLVESLNANPKWINRVAEMVAEHA